MRPFRGNQAASPLTLEEKRSVSLVDRSVELFLYGGESHFDDYLLLGRQRLLHVLLHPKDSDIQVIVRIIEVAVIRVSNMTSLRPPSPLRK